MVIVPNLKSVPLIELFPQYIYTEGLKFPLLATSGNVYLDSNLLPAISQFNFLKQYIQKNKPEVYPVHCFI